MSTMPVSLSYLLIPIIGLVFTFFGIPFLTNFPDSLISTFSHTPYLLLAGGVFLGVFFKRHRVALISIYLGLFYFLFQNAPAQLSDYQHVLFILLSILLPLNIAIASVLRDQTMLSFQAFILTLITIAQIILAYWFAKNYTDLLLPWLTYSPDFLQTLLPQSLPLSVIIAFFISFSVSLSFAFINKTIFHIAFFGVLLSCLFYIGSERTLTNGSYVTLASLFIIWGIAHNAYLIAYIDELTELPARRALNEELSGLRSSYSIAMLDIDHFKKFNDAYGHDVGDQVLRMVASKIRLITGGGKPFRYGGEEFCVVFPGKDSRDCFPHLSNLRETIENTSLILRNQDRPTKKPDPVPPRKIPWQEVKVTISIGIATKNDELSTSEEVIIAADQALYRSKEKGRNRITQHATKDYVPVFDEDEE